MPNLSLSHRPTDRVLLGLIGAGIQSSLTPAMHERECERHGLRCLYQLIDLDALQLTTDALPELLLSAEHMGFAGLNITFPCKQRVLPLLDRLSKEAEALGSVNTVVFDDGRRIGHNTDSYGFAQALQRDLAAIAKETVLQLGAGGAGAAVSCALLSEGVKNLTIYDVDLRRSEGLAQRLAPHFPSAHVAVTQEPRTQCVPCRVSSMQRLSEWPKCGAFPFAQTCCVPPCGSRMSSTSPQKPNSFASRDRWGAEQ
jgi:shikimate 5-dehydrogenase